jgi:hypothetical protein
MDNAGQSLRCSHPGLHISPELLPEEELDSHTSLPWPQVLRLAGICPSKPRGEGGLSVRISTHSCQG